MYALAAQYLGMRTLYLEAGSGSSRPMPPELVKAVRKYFTGFLVVGGGITSPETALALASAGADLLVVGNLFESEDYREKVNLIAAALRDKLKG
jgi:phosphoglycerol geranylgeranyltransferase